MLQKIQTATLGALLGAHLTAPAQDDPAMMDILPEHLLYHYTADPARPGINALDQLVAGGRRWDPGRTLRVCFYGGNRTVTTLIREVASEWNAFSSTKFDFGPPDGWYKCTNSKDGFHEIRVGFGAKGYWSAVGSDAESYVAGKAPSMNFEMFNTRYSEDRYPYGTVVAQAVPYHKAAIRHEFGHALSLLHEASNPNVNCFDEIRWIGPNNAYEYFKKTQNWDEDVVKRNLGHVTQTDPDYVAGEPDFSSNMFYALPWEILKNGKASKCYVPPNLLISKKDAEIVARIYPPVGASRLAADANLESANIRPMPKVLSALDLEDAQTRILADLESGDTYTRRNARVRLVELVSRDSSGAQVAGILSKVPQGSYRYQLGVAVAVANSPVQVGVDKVTLTALKTQQTNASDPTLKNKLRQALKKLSIMR